MAQVEETNPQDDDRPWLRLEELLDADQRDDIRDFLSELGTQDLARCFDRLGPERRGRVLERLDPDIAAELIEQLPWTQGGEMLKQAAPQAAAAILEELPSDEQADLITAIEPDNAAPILEQMEPEAARDAAELAAYPDHTAGGLMKTEYTVYPRSLTVGELVADLRRRVDEVAEQEIQYIYVVNRFGVLIGVLPLRDLLFARDSRAVDDMMIADPISVHVGAELAELAEVFERRPFLGLPVVDDDGVLLGVVLRSAVENAWGDRASADHLKVQGIVGGEELRSMPVLLRARRRLSWLSVNILLNIMAASVIAAYQDTLSEIIALAVFLPIISDMSGCSGSQAVAVSMRELTIGRIKPIDLFFVWRKEVAVGLVNGLALGILLAAAAWLWKGEPQLGVVVGTALALNTVLAVSIGGAIPLVLKRIGWDPALASGPILTTLTDMLGFFLALSFAAVSLRA